MNEYSDQVNIFDSSTWGPAVHLVGAGGINNALGPLLAKMGIREIHVWDNDILEARNCPTEVAYSKRMVGRPKVDAMVSAIKYLVGDATYNLDGNPHLTLHPNHPVCHDLGYWRIYTHFCRVDEHTPLSGVVISGVDSMASRKVIWQAVKNSRVDIPLYIDGRSAGEMTAIFAFSPFDLENAEIYESDWLFDDKEATPLRCGARNIGYIADYMASEIGYIITRYHRQLPIEFYTYRDFSPSP